MKRLILGFLLLLFQCVFSQNVNIDSIINSYPTKFSYPTKLADLIKNDFGEDSLRIKAIFTWIVKNIDYSKKESGKFLYTYKTEDERLEKEEKYIDKLSKRVISNNIAVCQGYSVLFKRVCDLMDIKSGIIEGFGKSHTSMIGRFTSNHVWNFVEIDGKKYLLDCTWGKRGITNKDGNKYFMVSPDVFINGHYPNKFSHSLLEDNLDKKTFINLPIIYKSNYSVFNVISPSLGKLKTNTNHTFKFRWFESIDSIEYVINNKFYPINDFNYTDNIVSFSISPELKRDKELLIYVNDMPFLGYKLVK